MVIGWHGVPSEIAADFFEALPPPYLCLNAIIAMNMPDDIKVLICINNKKLC
jgi:hypothetical protein